MPVLTTTKNIVRPSDQKSQPEVGRSLDHMGPLFQPISLRRRPGENGRDNARHADFLFSLAVFPDAVRIPFLVHLQQRDQNQCGFELLGKCSRRGGGQVHARDNEKNDSPEDSTKENSKITAPTIQPAKSSGKPLQASKVAAIFSSTSWNSTESNRWTRTCTTALHASRATAAGCLKLRDIRDPLYLNTYCPEGRKLHYKTRFLPNVSAATDRPSNSLYRLTQNGWSVNTDNLNTRWGRTSWTSDGNIAVHVPALSARPRAQINTAVSRHAGKPEERLGSLSNRQVLPTARSQQLSEDDKMVNDQRDALRGREGCLHSRMRKCIKFVKYREKLARQEKCPMKQETLISLSSRCQLVPRSVQLCKEHIDALAQQTNLVSAVSKLKISLQATNDLPGHSVTALSINDSRRFLHSTASPEQQSILSLKKTPYPTQSRITQLDKDQIRQALDVVHLLPKAHSFSTSGSSPGSNGCQQKRPASGQKDVKFSHQVIVLLPSACRSTTSSAYSCSNVPSSDVVDV